MNKVYVLGGAQTDFERNWSREGKNAVAMLREVVSDGCTAAGISYNEIVELNKESKVACFIGNFLSELYNQQSHIGALMTEVDPAFYGVPSVRCEAACAAGAAAMDLAMAKIASGQIDVAIVVGWALTNTVDATQGNTFLSHVAYQEKESVGDMAVLTNQYGRLLDAYLEKYNLPEDEVLSCLAHMTETAYENGKRNPLSQTRKMFMSEKQANMRGCATNPLTAGKLAKSDATMVTDGAAIVILASEDFVQQHSTSKKLPYIKGYGSRVAPMTMDAKLEESKHNEYLLPWTRQVIQDAYRTAGLTVEDIDIFELYDYYTVAELVELSCVGLTKPGEEYKFIQNGGLEFDSKQVINASGGLIGCGHPHAATGIRMCLDLYKQLTGTAGKCQVAGNPKNGLMLNMGGTATSNYAFILGVDD